MKSFVSPRLRPWRIPVARGQRQIVRHAGLALVGFLLAGGQLAGRPVPLAAAMVAAQPAGMGGVLTALGALVGYGFHCEAAQAVQQWAVTLLVLAAVALFQGTPLPARRWFYPAITSAVTAVLGLVSLDRTHLFHWAAQWLLAGTCTVAFRSAMEESVQGRIVLAAALLSALASIAAPVDLGLLCAVAMVMATEDLLTAAVAGLALELSGQYGGAAAASLLLPVLLCRALPTRAPMLRLLGFGMLPGTTLLFCGNGSLAQLGAGALGAILGRLLQGRLPFAATDRRSRVRERLESAAQILDLLGEQLQSSRKPATSLGEAESVYDGAAERVCRCCERFHRCWQHHAKQTYNALSGCARSILERGVAHPEDLPMGFRNNCCHLSGFVTAINQELEGMLFRRRYRMQIEECGRILQEEYAFLAEYLRAMEDEPASVATRFVPSVGISTASKDGNRANGDRGAYFSAPDGRYCVLLCDGMGSGPEAAQLSAGTVQLISRMLQAGMDADAALRMLNGAMVLRDDSRFATVDLLQIDLNTGEAELYKWGAAPSYLRDDEKVKKIGTAAPPPGIGVGGGHTPERYRLSLKRGEILVLVSDGAGGELTEATVSGYTGCSTRELAALLIAVMPGEDDTTAVAVCLQPRSCLQTE